MRNNKKHWKLNLSKLYISINLVANCRKLSQNLLYVNVEDIMDKIYGLIQSYMYTIIH